MSMMDTMNAAPPQGQPQQQGQPAPAPASFSRLGEGGDLQKQSDKVMELLSNQLWVEGDADKVNEQLIQDESDPAAVIGKFTGFLLLGVFAAFRQKQQMPEPIVMVDSARQVADQLTDIGLATKTVAPKDADDTAEGAALIGLQLFLQQAGGSMQADELDEYKQIITQIVQNSPGAAEVQEENQDEAAQLVAEESGGDQPNNEGDLPDDGGVPESQMQQPQQGGMSAAMGA